MCTLPSVVVTFITGKLDSHIQWEAPKVSLLETILHTYLAHLEWSSPILLSEKRKDYRGRLGSWNWRGWKSTTTSAAIAAAFPSLWTDWNPSSGGGKESLRVFLQTLLGSLWVVAKQPTNLSKHIHIVQETKESTVAFFGTIDGSVSHPFPYRPSSRKNRIST